jgi:hypothetical protein
MDNLLLTLNNNRLFWGLTMIVVNMGSRYIIGDLTKVHEAILSNDYFKVIILFCMFFMGSRDVLVAICLTFGFIIIVQTWLNEKSKYNLLPHHIKEKFIDSVSKKEYDDAMKIIEKYKIQNQK